MPAKRTSSAKKTAAAAAPTTPTTPTKVAAAAPSTPTKGKRAKSAPAKTAAPAAPAAPADTADTAEPVQEAVATTAAPVDDWKAIESSFSDLNGRLQEFRTYYSSILTDVKTLQRSVQKYLRESSKRNRRRKPADPNRPKRAPSGFAKPALISDELCSFLGKPKGTEMARTEVTKNLTAYIKEHALQAPDNKRRILPDNALQKLLNVGTEEEVTYFNLQKYMKVHFPTSASNMQLSAAV
jgi:chromatin remodeling complex protein RSC6